MAASASAAAAESPYPRDSAHFDRDATLSLFRLALRDVVELREIETLVAAGLNALVAANADAMRARESFMVSVFCGNYDLVSTVGYCESIGEVRGARHRSACGLWSEEISLSRSTQSRKMGLPHNWHSLLTGEWRIVVIIYCHGRSYKTMKDI